MAVKLIFVSYILSAFSEWKPAIDTYIVALVPAFFQHSLRGRRRKGTGRGVGEREKGREHLL